MSRPQNFDNRSLRIRTYLTQGVSLNAAIGAICSLRLSRGGGAPFAVLHALPFQRSVSGLEYRLPGLCRHC